MPQPVRHFRQILIWPLQVMPIRAGSQIQEPWDILLSSKGEHRWRELEDEFGDDSKVLDEERYSEFVTFLPYVRRFLYGEGPSRASKGADSPLRVFRRNDITKVRMTFPGPASEPAVFNVAHVDLCFLYDIDVVLLVVEIFANDLPLGCVQDAMYRFGRAYPTYWATSGRGGHCVILAEWIGADGSVLAVSDYEEREKYLRFVGSHRAPFFATHWTYLLRPLVPDYSEEKGLVRYRQIEYSRMPLMAYLAMDDARALTRADFVRLGLVTGPGRSDVLPYSARYMRDFEDRYCYDQFWNDERSGRPGTRFMSCGHGFVMVGDADDPYFNNREGLLGQFSHQYFLLFLIPHIHKATLLMLSDRMVGALNKLTITDPDSVRRFKRTIRQLLEIFLRFTHRYWFHEVSDQPQAKEIYRMTSTYLDTDRLYTEVRHEIEDMAQYLETDTLRRQANTVVRLTVVTVFGMIGSVVTGIFGMNLFGFAEMALPFQVLVLILVVCTVTGVLFYTLAKSKALADFLDAVSDERLRVSQKLGVLINVWRKKRR
ncbi:MAG TPA: CorA family divalent cation transporter [Casimicrobiaceae bacterium]|nr:CorA family divalent cation transporter [Casimicrobiaceae bacterium]